MNPSTVLNCYRKRRNVLEKIGDHCTSPMECTVLSKLIDERASEETLYETFDPTHFWTLAGLTFKTMECTS